MKFLFIALLISFPLVSSCDKLLKKEDDQSESVEKQVEEGLSLAASNSFLSLADFPAEGVNALTLTEARDELNSSNDVYNNSPKDTDENTVSKCLDKLDFGLKLLNANTVGLTGEADVLSCIKDPSNPDADDYQSFTKFSVKVTVNRFCRGVDMSPLVGKTFEAFDGAEFEENDKSCLTSDYEGVLANWELNFEAKTDEAEGKWVTRKATMNSDGKACKLTQSDSGRVLNNCFFVDYFQQTVTSGNSSTVSKELMSLKAEDLLLGKDPKDTWYSGGKFAVIANNVTGYLNYSSPTTIPTYTLSLGTDELSGTLSPSSSFVYGDELALVQKAIRGKWPKLFLNKTF